MTILILSFAGLFSAHFFIEKRSPALFDNVYQSLVIAPLFIFMELLFVLGYRPALQKRMHEKVKVAISTWRLSKDRRISTDVTDKSDD